MLLEADLPDDVDSLRALVPEQARALADLTDAKSKADARIERLRAIIEAFRRPRFGRKSEQLDPDQLELALEDIETARGSAQAEHDAAVPKARGERPRKTNRGSLPAHLERIEQVIDVEDKTCSCCGGALHQIGEDVAERLDVVPTTFGVLVTRRPRYGCRACESAVVQAPAPARIVEGGIPTEALSMPITCRFTGRRRSMPGRASSWIVPPLPTGLAGQHGICAPCATTFLSDCDDPSGCSPTRPPRPCSIPGASGPRPASSGLTPKRDGCHSSRFGQARAALEHFQGLMRQHLRALLSRLR
jgi:hypothetical protein